MNYCPKCGGVVEAGKGCWRCETAPKASESQAALGSVSRSVEFLRQPISPAGKTRFSAPYVMASGIVGAVLLMLTPFVPLASAPLTPTYTLMSEGAWGVIPLAVGACGLVLSLARRPFLLIVLGLLGVVAAIATFIYLRSHLEVVGSLGSILTDRIRMEWGWVAAFLGCLLLTAAGFMGDANLVAEGKPRGLRPQ